MPSPVLPYLTQNDPHGRVCLDGEAQCFQGAEGRIHLALCHTLVEGAWGRAALRAYPQVLAQSSLSPHLCLPTALTYLEVAIGAPRVPEGGYVALLQGLLVRLGVLGANQGAEARSYRKGQPASVHTHTPPHSRQRVAPPQTC